MTRLASAASEPRWAVIRHVAQRIPSPADSPTTLVAVDGADGAGKSVFADQLAPALVADGRTVIRASADDFHGPQIDRYRRGPTSPLGF